MPRGQDAFAIIDHVASSPVLRIAMVSLAGLLVAARIWHALRRRRAFRDFAAAHHLQFVGIIPGHARAPYTRIDMVSTAVLLSNVIEGQWDGLTVHLFDMPDKFSRGRWATAILVTVEDVLHRGAEAERAIAAVPKALIEPNLEVLFISPMLPLEVAELATWLSLAVAIAKAMERDAKADALSDATPDARPARRGMFGTIDPE